MKFDGTPDADYVPVWSWSADSVSTQWETVEIDLSPYITDPRQYELAFKDDSGDIEIGSGILVLQGIESPGFAEPHGAS